jgi:hypothetical protein
MISEASPTTRRAITAKQSFGTEQLLVRRPKTMSKAASGRLMLTVFPAIPLRWSCM